MCFSSPLYGGIRGGFQHLFLMVIVQGMDGAFIAEVRKLGEPPKHLRAVVVNTSVLVYVNQQFHDAFLVDAVEVKPQLRHDIYVRMSRSLLQQ